MLLFLQGTVPAISGRLLFPKLKLCKTRTFLLLFSFHLKISAHTLTALFVGHGNSSHS